MANNDPFDLQRFVASQRDVWLRVLRELRVAQKQTHSMWFIFPQIQGLGLSSTAQRYAISSLSEARAYLAHPILGPRLIECTTLVNDVQRQSVESILGYPDHLKFHSCMTLFSQVGGANSVFFAALKKYFNGQWDQGTMNRLTHSAENGSG